MRLDQQMKCKTAFRLKQANLYYTAATGLQNEKHMDLLKPPHYGILQYLLQQTGYPWDADLITLRATSVGTSVWSTISSEACPVSFTDEERQAAMAESRKWNESEQMMSRIRDYLDIDLEDGTESDNFERAVERNRQLRMERVRQAETDEREMRSLAQLAV
ncbi:Mitochondria protein Fmp29 [Penicillium lividum]|nr:Mitochondria protein Fmp29 [Penicillium lividum]